MKSNLLWKALRPGYWLIDRWVRNHRNVILLGFLLLTVGGQLLSNQMAGLMASLGSDDALILSMALLPNILIMLGLFALLGLGDLLYQLYEAPDLELLLAAPLPLGVVFRVKLLQGSRALLLPSATLAGFFCLLGIAQNAAAGYYPAVLGLLLAAWLLGITSLLILVMLMTRWLPAARARAMLPWALVSFSMLVLFVQTPLSTWFIQLPGPARAFETGLHQPGPLGILAACMGVLALCMVWLSQRIFCGAFLENRERMQLSPYPLNPKRTSRAKQPHILGRSILGRWLTKEWLELRRNTQALLNLAQPLVLVLVVFAPMMGQSAQALLPVMFWFLVFYLVTFLAVQPLGSAGAALLAEGRQLELLRSLPGSMETMLWGKLIAAWLPSVLVWTLLLIASSLALGYASWQALYLALMALWGLSGVLPLGLALTALRADFRAEQPKQRLNPQDSYLIMAANLGYLLLSAALFTWGVVRLFPDSPSTRVLAILKGYGGLDWLFAPGLGTMLALGATLLLGLGLIAYLWRMAVRRLDNWEV